MRLSILLFSLGLFFVQHTFAQKELSRTYLSKSITQLAVDANEVHSLTISAVASEEISVVVHIEGETSGDVVIKEQIVGNRLSLGFSAWPFAKTYNDKLSAHKITSVAVTITIPEDLFVTVTSQTSAVLATGAFQFLYVDIEDESCVLDAFRGNADITTNRGDVQVAVENKSTSAKAKTNYGSLESNLASNGRFIIYVESNHGDITLRQTQ